MKGEFKTQEAAFYCFYHNYDPDDLTKSERESCVRQGSQLNKQLIEGKDTVTIRFYNYWCKNNLYDFENKRVIKNDSENNDDNVKVEDGVIVKTVKELKVWNSEDECYDEYNEARVKTLLKIIDDKTEKIRKALSGVVVSDLKYKIDLLEEKLKHQQKEYKTVIEQRNKMEVKMEKAGWSKSMLKDYDNLKKFYLENLKSPIDN